MASHVDLGDALQTAREKRGLTQDDLSDKAGLAYSTLAKIERGAIKNPSVFTIYNLAKALNVSIEELMGSRPPAIKVPSKQKSNIKFVYCDVNGVLVRFFQRGFVSMARETGANPEQVENTFWHYNDAVNEGKMSAGDFNKTMALNLGAEKVDWKMHYMKAIEPITTMHDCLSEVAKHYKVGLLSNIWPGFVRELIDRGHLPKLDYAAIINSSSVHAIKPQTRIYEIAEQRAGARGREIFFIDDSRVNLVAAERCGWRVLWFDDVRPKESTQRVRTYLNLS